MNRGDPSSPTPAQPERRCEPAPSQLRSADWTRSHANPNPPRYADKNNPQQPRYQPKQSDRAHNPGVHQMAQIVKAEGSQTGAGQSLLVAPAESRAVEVAAELAGEDEVVVGDPVLSPAEPGES